MAWRAYLSRNLQSLKVFAVEGVPEHAAAKQWWVQNYADLKALNPRFPLLLRGTIKAEQPPQIMVEYDWGKFHVLDVSNMSVAEIDGKVKEAVEAGETAPRSYWQSVKPLTLPTVIE